MAVQFYYEAVQLNDMKSVTVERSMRLCLLSNDNRVLRVLTFNCAKSDKNDTAYRKINRL